MEAKEGILNHLACLETLMVFCLNNKNVSQIYSCNQKNKKSVFNAFNTANILLLKVQVQYNTINNTLHIYGSTLHNPSSFLT